MTNLLQQEVSCKFYDHCEKFRGNIAVGSGIRLIENANAYKLEIMNGKCNFDFMRRNGFLLSKQLPSANWIISGKDVPHVILTWHGMRVTSNSTLPNF